MDDHAQQASEGSAYGRRLVSNEAERELLSVGPGTPGGEFLRRYWHPIALSAELTSSPKQLRILGEDLILFRDGQGRAGLLTPNCAHRGTSLYYGKVEEDGLRCCYHGWKFDVEGRCLDQPCEPNNGGAARERIRQPWYPVEERYGLVFAYMGPPAKKPVLPRWEVLEDLQPGETLFTHGYTGFGVGADDTIRVVPMNWLRNVENIMDPYHVPMLHTRHRAVQYTPEAGRLPEVSFEDTALGMNYIAHRQTGEGMEVRRVNSVMLPTLFMVPDQQLNVTGPSSYIRWVTPVDDDHHALFHAMRVAPGKDGRDMFLRSSRPRPMGTDKMWSEMTPEEHQHFPTDWEAMCSLGSIATHIDEHLRTSDRGVMMLRRLLQEQIRLVQQGGDPVGVTFDPAKARYKTEAGNYFRKQEDKVGA